MKIELISSEGFKNFYDEFNKLYKIEKPHWVKEKEIAAAFGDRSENAEYLSAKEMLRNIDKRLRYLDKIIKYSKVVDIENIPHDKINFGTKVELQNLETDEIKSYTILGIYESDPSKNIISNKSPLGRLLLGKNEADEITLSINGTIYTDDNIKEYLAMRNLMETIRDTGEITKGPKPFSLKDSGNFANGLNQILQKAINR